MPSSSQSSKRIQLLQMQGIVKRFPGVLAVNNVDFDVKSGEIHALLGENGAGKSTLMKMLYGLYHPDEGTILLDGVETRIRTPQDAIRQGIGMIHQHFMLVPSLTVAENVALGLRSSRGVLLDLDLVTARLEQLSEQYNLKVNPRMPVWQLAVGEQQRVEILRALYKDAALLILDEPTAVLTPQEVDDLFQVLRRMANEGIALIFISHKLREVLSISNRVTVLRDGARVATVPTETTTRMSLAEMMVGRPVLLEYQISAIQRGEPRLHMRDVVALNERGDRGLNGVSLDVHGGEIVGVAGVSGNGQRELAQVVAGLRSIEAGQIEVNGKSVVGASPGAIHQMGVSYIPEERMVDGVVKEFTVAENLVLRDHIRKPFVRGGYFMDFKAIVSACQQAIRSFEIKTPGTETPIRSLSGGNIQKLVLARELMGHPQVLVASQPTRGVDIGATEYIHKRLLEERQSGRAILLISEDLDEIRALSDRIVVMYEGRIVGEVARGEADVQTLGAMMAGVGVQSGARV